MNKTCPSVHTRDLTKFRISIEKGDLQVKICPGRLLLFKEHSSLRCQVKHVEFLVPFNQTEIHLFMKITI